MNYSISLELLKLEGAKCLKVDGQNMVCIPVNAPYNFIGQKGVYTNLQMQASPNNQFGSSHFIKPSYSKDAYDKLTDEQKKHIAIIGNATEFATAKNDVVEKAPEVKAEPATDLPF